MTDKEKDSKKSINRDRSDDPKGSRHSDLRRQAELAFEEGADTFKLFSKQILMAVAIIQDEKIKYCNQVLADILEYSIDEIMGWQPDEFEKVIHADFREFVTEQARKKQRGENDVIPEYIYKLVSKTGCEIWVNQFSRTINYEGKTADLVTMVDITMRKEAEETLKEREEQYRNLIESMNDGFAIIDENSRITYLNKKMIEMLGYKTDEMMGRDVGVFLKQPRILFFQPETHELGDVNGKAVEAAWVKNDGSLLHSLVSVTPIINREKQYIGFHAVVTDITERKNAEEAVRESEARYRELFDNAVEGISIVDADENIVFCNEAFARILEIESVQKTVGRNLSEFMGSDQRKIMMIETDRRRRNKLSRYDLNITTSKGNKRTILVSVSPRFDDKGEYVGSFGTILDITKRKQAEATLIKDRDGLNVRVKERTIELAEVNRQLKKSIFDLYNIFELSRNFNALLDYRSLLESYMAASMTRMGSAKAALYIPRDICHSEFELARYQGEEPFPDPIVEVDPEGACCTYITSLNRPVKIKEIRRQFASEEKIRFVELFSDGLIIPLVYQSKLRGILIISTRRSSRMYESSDLEFLAILANQTAVLIENARLYQLEKDAQGELQKTQGLLGRSEKLAALGELSAKVAHEINNPLGIINNYLLLISRDIKSAGQAHEYIRVVRGELERIASIVRQLLDFHRPIITHFLETELRQLIEETLALMKYQFEESKITVSLKVGEFVPTIKGWPDGLKQVFMNLLVNARDATGDGGEIYIDVSGNEKDVIILFEDNGPGIPKDTLPHVFESFFTTKGDKGGAGLGLSVCKRIINNHGGTIEFANTDKGGSFKIVLPIEQKEMEYDWRI